MISSDERINHALRAALEYGRLSHAYITGSAELVQVLTAAVVCESGGGGRKPCGVCRHCQKAQRGVHPDIITLGLLPDKREIVVDQIREIREDIIVVPNEADRKVYVISNADSMNKAAQNALLKMLEEPPAHTVFVLYAENPAELLTTVRSRCVEIKNAPEPEQDDGEQEELVLEFFAALERGACELTAFSFRLDKLDKPGLAAFVDGARSFAALRMKESAAVHDESHIKRYADAEMVMRRAEEFLALNVGIVHISGLICASLI